MQRGVAGAYPVACCSKVERSVGRAAHESEPRKIVVRAHVRVDEKLLFISFASESGRRTHGHGNT